MLSFTKSLITDFVFIKIEPAFEPLLSIAISVFSYLMKGSMSFSVSSDSSSFSFIFYMEIKMCNPLVAWVDFDLFVRLLILNLIFHFLIHFYSYFLILFPFF